MSKQYIADAALLLVAFIWGTTFVVVQRALSGIGPFYFVALRFFLAFLFLALFTWRRWANLDRATALHGGLAGLFLSGGYILQTMGLKYTSAANAGFITGLSVVIVPLLGSIISRACPGASQVASALLAATGLGFLTLKEELALNPGDILVLLCALCFAMHILLVERFTCYHDSLPFTSMQLGTVALAAFLLALPAEQLPARFTSAVWQAFLLTALPATSLAYLVQNKVQQFTTATHTAIIFSMEPVFAALAARFWGQEFLTWCQVVGCLLILAGMLLAEFKPKEIALPEGKTR